MVFREVRSFPDSSLSFPTEEGDPLDHSFFSFQRTFDRWGRKNSPAVMCMCVCVCVCVCVCRGASLLQGHLSGQASLLACGEGGAAGWRGGWGPAVSACAWSCPGQEQEGGDSGGRASPVPPSTQSLRRGRGAPRVGETQDQNTILMFSAYPVGLLRSWNGTLGGQWQGRANPGCPSLGRS